MTAFARADFQQTDGVWRIKDVRFVKTAPFWLLGYLASKKTEHFTIYYRGESADYERIDKAGRQLEKSYRALRRKGLPGDGRNLAVFLDRKDDFAAVTGVSSDRFDGAAMVHVEDTKGVTAVGNRLIYINNAQFSTGQRLWGMRDRQETITHELVHLNLSRFSRPWMPSWVIEGIALHFAKQSDSWARLTLRRNPQFEKISLIELSKRYSLAEGESPETVQAGYLLSGEAFGRLARGTKDTKLVDFYKSFANYNAASIKAAMQATGKIGAGKNEAVSMEAARVFIAELLLKQHFGKSLAELDAEVKAHVRKRGF